MITMSTHGILEKEEEGFCLWTGKTEIIQPDAQCTIEPVMLELLFLVHLSTHFTLQNYAVYRTAIYNVNIHAVSRASECSLSG